VKLLGIRDSIVKEAPNNVLTKMNSIKTNRQKTLDLALAYYKLGEFKNPLRIESFLSSITVIVRDTWKDEKYKDRVPTNFLKKRSNLYL
jgi:hypothetical protein